MNTLLRAETPGVRLRSPGAPQAHLLDLEDATYSGATIRDIVGFSSSKPVDDRCSIFFPIGRGGRRRKVHLIRAFMVGLTGFEPATP